MPDINVSISIPVPADTLIYDIGREQFVCRECNKRTPYEFINARPTRNGGLSTPEQFKLFLNEHGSCILKKREKEKERQSRDRYTGPCRQDYRDANGHGPHECSKQVGHSGACGR
jgi:hypothetical protein